MRNMGIRMFILHELDELHMATEVVDTQGEDGDLDKALPENWPAAVGLSQPDAIVRLVSGVRETRLEEHLNQCGTCVPGIYCGEALALARTLRDELLATTPPDDCGGGHAPAAGGLAYDAAIPDSYDDGHTDQQALSEQLDQLLVPYDDDEAKGRGDIS